MASLTKKSSLYFMFLKSPPTMAARWATWVGLCSSNTRLACAISLEATEFHHSVHFVLQPSVCVCARVCGLVCLPQVAVFGAKEYPFFVGLGVGDHVTLESAAYKPRSSRHQHLPRDTERFCRLTTASSSIFSPLSSPCRPVWPPGGRCLLLRRHPP